jgi:hypothetical protein
MSPQMRSYGRSNSFVEIVKRTEDRQVVRLR